MKMSSLIKCLCVAFCLCTMSCAPTGKERATKARLVLGPCNEDVEHQKNLARVNALCGTFEVFENAKTKKGKKIALNVAVIPALASKPIKDPVFIITGGPGSAATESWRLEYSPWGEKLHINRDIVLIDQRGTGASNPLDCYPDGGIPFEELFEFERFKEKSFKRMEACVKNYDADVHHYTTDVAMDDLNEVRLALGYQKINIWGSSYGTRAALVYLRRHGDTVRSVVLEAIAPLEMKILGNSVDGNRAMDKLLADCKKDSECNNAFSGLDKKLRTLLFRLKKSPITTRLVHPRTGEIKEVTIEAPVIRGILFSTLYDPVLSALVPLAIEKAYHGDFSVFATMTDMKAEVGKYFSFGMQSAVLCNEDLAHMTDEETKPDAGPDSGIFIQKEMTSVFRDICPFFDGASVPESYFDSVVSDVPVLILSGDLDPITPSRWGDLAALKLGNSRHVVVPGSGHGVSHHQCVSKMIVDFIDDATATGIETSCLKAHGRPPFFIDHLGPVASPKKKGGR
jgi:pimeloyl-ACP methyl ester carboxylesterase